MVLLTVGWARIHQLTIQTTPHRHAHNSSMEILFADNPGLCLVDSQLTRDRSLPFPLASILIRVLITMAEDYDVSREASIKPSHSWGPSQGSQAKSGGWQIQMALLTTGY